MQKKVTARVEIEFYPFEYDSNGTSNLNNLGDQELTEKTKEMIEDLFVNLDDGMWGHVEEIVVTSS